MGKENDCLGCGVKFKQKDACVQCNICGLWSHRTCSGLTLEFFNCMAEQIKATGSSYWACRACKKYAEGMNHRIREVHEKAQEAINIAKESAKENRELKDKMEKQAERTDKKMAQTEIDIYEEMSMREEKRKNVVMHGLNEPQGEDGWARMEQDRKKLNEIFRILDINVAVETDVEFCRRIGEKSEKARPLVVGFYTEWAKSIVLKNSRYLAETDLNMVSIVPDLTEKQRKAEKDLQTEAERRNRSELTDQDRSKNLVWKVVGKRGQKRLVKVYERESAARGRGGGAGRGGFSRGRGRGGAQPATLGVELLPARGAEPAWQPTVRGEEQQVRAASGAAAKRKRSGEEEQARKTRGRPTTRGRPPRQMSSEEEEGPESSQPPAQQNSHQSSQQQQISQPASQDQEQEEMEGDTAAGELAREKEVEDLGGIRLGRE
jgi:hypothetical protein